MLRYRIFRFVTDRMAARVRAILTIGVALVLPLGAESVLAQASGAISGRIADRMGASLPGARVIVPSLGLRTSTNPQGEFILSGVPDGTYEVQIEYLGMQSVTRTVTVADGGRAALSVMLTPAVAVARDSIEEVVVYGSAIRDASARALNQQRVADNLINVVSSDSIGKFPDPNIAEALQRTPGIAIERDQGEGRYINVRGAPSEFTAVSIDGVMLASPDPSTRAIDLDTIPSDIVSQIEISKSLMPEQDADSIAGAVNIVTQSPFDADGMRIRGSLGLSHNEYGDTRDRRGNFLFSNQLGADQNIGVLVSASYSKTDREVDNVESEWDLLERPEGGEVLGVVENLFKDYDTRRERYALTGVLDFRATDIDRWFVRASYARFEDDEYRNRLGIIWDDGVLQPGATDRTATWNNSRIEKQFRHRVQRNELTTYAFGGEHERGRYFFDYTAAYSIGEQTYPHRRELLWRSALRPALSYDYTVSSNEPFISLFESNEHLDVGSYAFRENTFRSNDTEEKEFSLAGNVGFSGMLFDSPAEYKFGLKWRSKDKEADEERWRDRSGAAAPDGTLGDFLSSTKSDNYDYLLGNKMSPSVTRAYLSQIASISRTDSTRRIPQSITSDYEVTEDIYAGYGQARVSLGATDALFGLRIERTEVDGEAPVFNEDTGDFSVTSARRNYTNWFPGVNVRHAFTDQLVGRAALTRGISRPNFRDIVPRALESDTTTVLPQVALGNPNLRATMSNNVDLSLEYYIEPLGLISAGMFYKDLEDYQYTLRFAGEYAGAPARLVQPRNARSGEIKGFEITWSQQFDRLPGWWSGFGILANYTYTDAKMKVGGDFGGRNKLPLEGQSKETLNLSGFYETDRFNVRLSYTTRDDYLDEVDERGSEFDLYWRSRGQVDLTASVQVTPQWETFFEAKNLTDTAGKRYFGSRSRTYEFEKFGASYFLGLRFNL
jgi:TonB-dependent receptor